MRQLLIWLGLLWGSSAHGYGLALEHFSMQFQQFDHNRDPYAPQYTDDWLYRAQANFNFSLMGALYWVNNVHTEAIRAGAVKTVGWHWEIGLRLHEQVSLFHEHHSRHIMEDKPNETARAYPVEDSYGLRFIVVEDTSKVAKSLSGHIFGGK